MPRVEAWLDEIKPDVLAMQETKLSDDAFPALAFQALGYDCVHHGQGQWNGVAILSKVGIVEDTANFADGADPDPEARIITALCGGIRVSSVYVPNGRSLDHEHYQYKLAWLERLQAHVKGRSANDAVVVMGDFNIAPEDRDVYDPSKYVGATHVSEPERATLAALRSWGMEDLFRKVHPDAEKVFSWWDYRAGDFHQGRGMRIDLVLGTASVAARCKWAVIDRNARKGQLPSDHAPVVVDLDD